MTMSSLVAFTENEECIIEMYARQIKAELQMGTLAETLKLCLTGLAAPYILDEAFNRALNFMRNGG